MWMSQVGATIDVMSTRTRSVLFVLIPAGTLIRS